MNGDRITSRITSEERSTLSSYIGLGIAVVLAVGAIFLFLLSHEEKKEITTFDPNRPVPDDVTLRRRLKPEQYRVVRENGTETAFQNEFWDNERAGIYCDVVTGEPLFSSVDKFDGGTGRPSFTKPISKDLLVERPDNSNGMQRIDVRAKRSDAHLGHLFPDPASPTGQRYAVESAALRFIPLEQMKDQGYEKSLSFVEKK
ncbi:MAG: peptide-methionine (R)-S-oxide reductase [Verrucomicrobia bacterium]|nr:MAG: peptide-methionine (R)-S-oxide reductase [Verrucomicrobiota bacterium]PYL03708.1 MAG: peptide-methionine (R)-S-oxide reductase [Verrucomicrobiota bacterium]